MTNQYDPGNEKQNPMSQGITPEKETPTPKTNYVDARTPEERANEPKGTLTVSNPPTPKTVEEVVEEFEKEFSDPKWDFVQAGVDEPWETEIVTDWLRTTLIAQTQAADERLREVCEYMMSISTFEVVKEKVRAIAAKHGITNL